MDKYKNIYILDFEHCWFADSYEEDNKLEFELRKYNGINQPCYVESRLCKESIDDSFTQWQDEIINNDKEYTYTNGEYEVETSLFIKTKRYNHIGKNIKEIEQIRPDIIDASWLFSECWYAEDTSWFPEVNTENIENMSFMYYNCARLKELDLSKYNVIKVKNMSHMFDTCAYLEKLDLRNFDMSSVKNTDYMLMNCINLFELRLDNCEKETIRKIIESEKFPTYRSGPEIDASCVYNPKDNNLTVIEKNEIVKIPENSDNLILDEEYAIYNGQKEDLSFLYLDTNRKIYCKLENTIGLIAPKYWLFVFIDEQPED